MGIGGGGGMLSPRTWLPIIFARDVEPRDMGAKTTILKGRHQNSSVETGNFLQKYVKCKLVRFCRSVTPLPHARVKGHLGQLL